MNFPNRVPVLANPQEGSSIFNLSSAFQATSASPSFIIASPFGPFRSEPSLSESSRFALGPFRTISVKTASSRVIRSTLAIRGKRQRPHRNSVGPLGHRRGGNADCVIPIACQRRHLYREIANRRTFG